MTLVDRLFSAYVAAAHCGGDAAPAGYLDQVSGVDRAELIALIDGYLVRATRKPVHLGSMQGTPRERTVETLARAISG